MSSQVITQKSQENRSTLLSDRSKQVAFDSKRSSQNGVSPLELAFMMLVKSANITTQTAAVRAKDLQQNAIEQKQLNEEDEKLQLVNVPAAEKHVVYYTLMIGPHGTVFKTRHTKIVANTGPMNQAEEANRKIMAKREIVSQKLGLLALGAQRGEQQASSAISESVQSTQEGSKVLTVLKALTFLALLRKPVQG